MQYVEQYVLGESNPQYAWLYQEEKTDVNGTRYSMRFGYPKPIGTHGNVLLPDATALVAGKDRLNLSTSTGLNFCVGCLVAVQFLTIPLLISFYNHMPSC
ncbi:hypothetical protein NC652_035686 [Populus alba x Populus x berolinensis]|nr:hypothetical protein NC652_035686 [Populus alba x Populus x berolinensis]